MPEFEAPPEPSPIFEKRRAEGRPPGDLAWEYTHAYLARSEAYPLEPIADLADRLREIAGEDATIEPLPWHPSEARPGWGDDVLRVAVPRRAHRDIEAIAAKIAALDTNARFRRVAPVDEAGVRFDVELQVYARNPHGPGPHAGEYTWNGKLRDREGANRWDQRCACGTLNVVLVAPKGYPGQEKDPVHFACRGCGRRSILVYVPEMSPMLAYAGAEAPAADRATSSPDRAGFAFVVASAAICLVLFAISRC